MIGKLIMGYAQTVIFDPSGRTNAVVKRVCSYEIVHSYFSYRMEKKDRLLLLWRKIEQAT